jgi:light-regulated signal transduction histidine kinase (bacteriophytochrome)
MFAYVASHDLQEPLRKLANFTELLAERYRGRLGTDADRFIETIVGSATRMGSLIQDLLAYSRTGRGDPRLEPTDFEAVVSHAVEDLGQAVRESGAVVTRDPLPTLPANAVQMGQVFLNLIGNAMKFRRQEPPRIHVSAHRRDNVWIFSVRDNGIGFDPKYGEKIFAVFQRLHPKEAYPGTGIGLAICKKIIEQHGGLIWATSEPGKGSSFFFALPARTAPTPPAPTLEALRS